MHITITFGPQEALKVKRAEKVKILARIEVLERLLKRETSEIQKEHYQIQIQAQYSKILKL